MNTPETIGIIAGRGQFPALTARAAKAKGLRVVVAGFKGFTDPGLASEADQFKMLRLGRLNQLFRYLRKAGAVQVCMAGAINKPKALSLRPDLRALRLLSRMRGKGDDALLRALVDELESEGFQVIQAADLAADLVPDLRGPKGVLSSRKPSPEEWDDLRLGWRIAKAVGGLDIGQCVVLKRGVVSAVESIEGTDAAVKRGGELAGPGAVAVKVCKPGQEERVDLPSLGPTTIQSLKSVQGACLGFEADKTLFFDLEQSLGIADAAGICVIGLTAEDAEP